MTSNNTEILTFNISPRHVIKIRKLCICLQVATEISAKKNHRGNTILWIWPMSNGEVYHNTLDYNHLHVILDEWTIKTICHCYYMWCSVQGSSHMYLKPPPVWDLNPLSQEPFQYSSIHGFVLLEPTASWSFVPKVKDLAKDQISQNPRSFKHQLLSLLQNWKALICLSFAIKVLYWA